MQEGVDRFPIDERNIRSEVDTGKDAVDDMRYRKYFTAKAHDFRLMADEE